MSKTLRQILWIILATAALIAGVWTAWQIFPRAAVTPTPIEPTAMSFPDLDGYPRQLSDWRGKVLLVNFWATWCGPCREEIPLLNRAQTRYGTAGFQVIGIAIDDFEAVSDYQRNIKFAYPVLIGELDGMNLMSYYGNTAGALPFSVILDTHGVVRGEKIGAYTRDELDHVIKELLPKL